METGKRSHIGNLRNKYSLIFIKIFYIHVRNYSATFFACTILWLARWSQDSWQGLLSSCMNIFLQTRGL